MAPLPHQCEYKKYLRAKTACRGRTAGWLCVCVWMYVRVDVRACVYVCVCVWKPLRKSACVESQRVVYNKTRYRNRCRKPLRGVRHINLRRLCAWNGCVKALRRICAWKAAVEIRIDKCTGVNADTDAEHRRRDLCETWGFMYCRTRGDVVEHSLLFGDTYP